MELLSYTPEVISCILSKVPYESIADIAFYSQVLPNTFSSVATNYAFWNERVRVHIGLTSGYTIEQCKEMESVLSLGGWNQLLSHACSNDMVELFDVCILNLQHDTNMESILQEALNKCVSSHSINVFKNILSSDIDIQVPNHELILYVVNNGTYEMVEVLLSDQRCDPSTPDNTNSGSNSVLWIACSKDDVDMFKLLLTDRRIDITDYNYGVIECAITFNSLRMLDFLSTYPLTAAHM